MKSRTNILLYILIQLITFQSTSTNYKQDAKSKETLVKFRKGVEEIADALNTNIDSKSDLLREKLVSILGENLKEIFKEFDIKYTTRHNIFNSQNFPSLTPINLEPTDKIYHPHRTLLHKSTEELDYNIPTNNDNSTDLSVFNIAYKTTNMSDLEMNSNTLDAQFYHNGTFIIKSMEDLDDKMLNMTDDNGNNNQLSIFNFAYKTTNMTSSITKFIQNSPEVDSAAYFQFNNNTRNGNSYERTTLTPLLVLIEGRKKYDKKTYLEEITGSEDSLALSGTTVIERPVKANTNVNSYALNNNLSLGKATDKRSCFFCNNVLNETCSEPENKIVPSILCDTPDELCYSQHTPFGIVDRGCFNINNNLTIYVCSCNLCNYLAIGDMPYLFTKKEDWVNNIIELSQSKRLKKSVLKNMSCLSCVVSSSYRPDVSLDTNCMEGNIGAVATTVCEENEVCAIKVIRSKEYIWRGCVKQPQYNYFITLCDADLCNSDKVVSIYDL